MKKLLANPLSWIIVFAAIIKIFYLMLALPDSGSAAALSLDALYHYQWAAAIADGDIFSNAPYFRAPLYPFLLAGLMKLSGSSLVFIRVIQLLSGCVMLVFIFILSLRYFGKKEAIAACLIYLLYPITTYFEGELLLDSIFSLLAIISFYFFVSGAGNSRRNIISAIFFALAALTRPTVLVFLPVVIFILYRRPIADTAIKHNFRYILQYLVVLAIMVSPITLINYYYSGQLIVISYQGGVNFYIGNNESADGLTSSLPPYGNNWSLAEADYHAQKDSGEKLLYSQQSRYWFKKGFTFILSHPGEFVSLLAKKIYFTFSGHEISNNRQLNESVIGNDFLGSLPIRLSLILSLAIIPLFLRKSKRPGYLRLYGIVLFYGLAISFFFVTSRFRLPLVPLLTILAGAGIGSLIDVVKLQRYDYKLFFAIIAGIGVFILATIQVYPDLIVNPRHGLFLRGNSLLRQGQYRQAIACFDSLARTAPYYENSFLNKGIAYLKLGAGDSAAIFFKRELAENRQSAEAANNLGVTFLLSNNYDSALIYCGIALGSKPYYLEAAINYMRAAQKLYRPELLNTAESKRIEVRPYVGENPAYLFDEGLYFVSRRRYSEAIDNQIRVIDLTEEKATSISFTTQYSQLADFDRKSLLKLAFYQLGYLYGLTGVYDESIRYSRLAIETDREMKEAYLNLISAYRVTDNDRAADSIANIYLSIWPDDREK